MLGGGIVYYCVHTYNILLQMLYPYKCLTIILVLTILAVCSSAHIHFLCVFGCRFLLIFLFLYFTQCSYTLKMNKNDFSSEMEYEIFWINVLHQPVIKRLTILLSFPLFLPFSMFLNAAFRYINLFITQTDTKMYKFICFKCFLFDRNRTRVVLKKRIEL